MTVGPSLAASLESMAHRGNVTNLNLFYNFSIGITLVDVHLNWLIWCHFIILEGGLLVILIECVIFLLPLLDITRMSMSTVSFLLELDSLELELSAYGMLSFGL